MPKERRAFRGPSRLATAALWLLAGLLVLVGMALDARGLLVPSLLLFLLASAALVAPLALHRRAGARGGSPDGPPHGDDPRA
ncbi:MAG: hypothetical protein R6X22_01925 [Gemmatimonadota bacterium]|jgi:hypothetical protein